MVNIETNSLVVCLEMARGHKNKRQRLHQQLESLLVPISFLNASCSSRPFHERNPKARANGICQWEH